VAASRGREHLMVIASDKARLEESIGRSGARQSASIGSGGRTACAW
jgi:hypothetical protein